MIGYRQYQWLLNTMLKVNKQMPNFKGIMSSFKVRVGSKQGPTNVSPVEQRIYRMGYRLFGVKIVNVKVSNKKSKLMRYRTYMRGNKCIRIGDRINDIPNVVVNA